MNYITTSDLRTKSVELVKSLKEGKSVSLIHRSRIVGVIQPAQETAEEAKVLTKEGIEKIKKIAQTLNLPKTSYKQRERIYRAHLMKKYGKGLS